MPKSKPVVKRVWYTSINSMVFLGFFVTRSTTPSWPSRLSCWHTKSGASRERSGSKQCSKEKCLFLLPRVSWARLSGQSLGQTSGLGGPRGSGEPQIDVIGRVGSRVAVRCRLISRVRGCRIPRAGSEEQPGTKNKRADKRASPISPLRSLFEHEPGAAVPGTKNNPHIFAQN
jgi:hypothetical protein